MRFVIVILLLLAAPTRADVPLLDLAAVPGLGTNGRAELSRTLVRNLPRAFAIGPGGAYASRSGNAAPEAVAAAALEACQAHTPGRVPCQLWMRDLEIVFPSREWAPAPPPGEAGWREAGRETVPDARFLWWGPQRARGVVLWAHGRNAGGDNSRGRQPQAWLRHFNNAGFDVWRFDRDPATDFVQRAAGWMRADLAALRAQGYRRIVVAGQSRGGWNALQALDTPGLAEVTIAIAPAALGSMDEAGQARQMAALRGVVAQATGAGQARVAVANFQGDPFDGLPEERAAALRALAPAAGAFLLIDRPDGLTGHTAGASASFSLRFGGCLLRFALEEPAPASC